MRRHIRKIEWLYYKKMPSHFNEEDNKFIDIGIQIGYLNEKAFTNITPLGSNYMVYRQDVRVYPLTKDGYEYIHRNQYIIFRDSIPIKILSDILIVIAFLLALFGSFSGIENILNPNATQIITEEKESIK